VIRYLTQVRGVNLAGVKLLLQFRDVADLMEEMARQLTEMDENGDRVAQAADEKEQRGRERGTRF
jgi:hypothetical protein